MIRFCRRVVFVKSGTFHVASKRKSLNERNVAKRTSFHRVRWLLVRSGRLVEDTENKIGFSKLIELRVFFQVTDYLVLFHFCTSSQFFAVRSVISRPVLKRMTSDYVYTSYYHLTEWAAHLVLREIEMIVYRLWNQVPSSLPLEIDEVH